MKTKTKNGFKLSMSGHASQVVLLCHGGWLQSDGTTRIPSHLRVCFYAGHGHFTIGQSVYSEVIKAPVLARGGLLKRITLSDEDLSALAAHRNMTTGAMRETMLSQAVGVYDSFGGGNPMFDYALSREKKGPRLNNEKELFREHERGAVDGDVDLMMLKTSSTRHLSDAFEIIKDIGYQTMHFGACRVSYGANPADI